MRKVIGFSIRFIVFGYIDFVLGGYDFYSCRVIRIRRDFVICRVRGIVIF